MENLPPITVEVVVRVPVEKAWKVWTAPEHIVKWAFASDNWEAPYAENDVREGGRFKTVMTAKDKSAEFDFTGTYTRVEKPHVLEYEIDGGRRVKVKFTELPDRTHVTETFDPETENTEAMQRAGWQAIIDNFRKYAESGV